MDVSRRRLGLVLVIASLHTGPIWSVPQSSASQSADSAAVSCIDARTGTSFEFHARHLLSSGTIDSTWSQGSAQLCLGLLEGLQRNVLADGSGGTYVGWVDEQRSDPDISLRRLTGSGENATGWPADGLPVCRAPYSQYQLDIAPDGNGGVFLAWLDYRAGGVGRVFVQHISAAGAVVEGWPSEGRAISDAVLEQSVPRLAADGAAVELDYDAAGRLSQVSHAHDQVAVAYDATTGLLSSASADSGASLAYGYAGALPTSETWSFEGGPPVSVEVEYDDDLRVVLQEVSGDTVGYSYDRDGLLVRAGAERLVRDPGNGLLSRSEVGALITEYAYNGAGELMALETRTTGSQVLHREGLTRDSLGRVTTRKDSVWTGSAFQTRIEVYGYDAVGRLETVTRGGSLIATYGYDANGNRTSFSGPSATDTASADYDAQDRLLRYQDTAYAYTRNGELASVALGSDTTRYQYDATGALRRVRQPSGEVLAYEIDAQGRRVGRGDPGAPERRWVYQNALNIVAELDTAGDLASRYVYGSRGHVPDLMRQGDSLYRLVTDHLGSVIAVVNTASGAVTARRRYDAWGVVEEDTAPGLTPFGFAGGLTDTATRLVRFGARDYDPEAGRWTSKDPIGFEGGLPNLYGYVASRVTTSIDPRGLWIESAADAISLGLSLRDLLCKPSLGNAFWAGLDALSLFTPLVPAPGIVRHGDELLGLAAGAKATIFKTGHYASRLEAAGVNTARAESVVAREVGAMRANMGTGADVAGRVRIDNVVVEYRARLLPDGSVNVGTIFPVR